VSSIRDMLIVLLICGALCTTFFFIGKGSINEKIIYHTDTLVVSKTDTAYIKVKVPAVIKDTIVIIDSVAYPYEYASIDTTLVNSDSSSVALSIGYDTHYKQFSVEALFRSVSKQIIVKEYIEIPLKEKMFYTGLSIGKAYNNPVANVYLAMNIGKDYYIGVDAGYKTLMLNIGRRW